MVSSIAACQTDEEPATKQPAVEICLTGHMEAQADIATRTAATTPMPAGKTVYVWANNKTEPVFKAWKLTSSENGALNHDYGYQKYFPSDVNRLSLYAVCGNFENPPSGVDNPFAPDTETESLTHNVSEEQTTYKGNDSDIHNSDLLYAAQSITRENQAITFKHLLSKIEVILKAGKGVKPEELNNEHTRVSLMNTRLQVAITPGAQYPLTIDTNDDNNPVTEIYMDTKTTDDFDNKNNTYAQAIIVPQTIGTSANKVPFISVSLGSNGATLNYKAHQTFKSGCKYTYHITVNENRLDGMLVTGNEPDNAWNVGNATEVESTEHQE